MTRRRPIKIEGPTLFDLPLDSATGDSGAAAATLEPPPTAHYGDDFARLDQPDLFADGEPLDDDRYEDYDDDEYHDTVELDPATPSRRRTAAKPSMAGLKTRLLSAGADLLIHAGVVAGVSLGLFAMALEPQPRHWPAFLVLLAAFSFLYTVVSLAFWGQTAGMAWCHVYSQDREDQPLSFAQATLRWAGGLLTLAMAGLPLLTSLAGRSLSDWISRTVTLQMPSAAPR